MIAKCGEVRLWHWAHKGGQLCDRWWENETQWHRDWKNQFPVEWQEIVHPAENGELHIADVKTDRDWVIEFQHSYLEPGERRSRDAFYRKLIWVVDGKRRKTDWEQFRDAWETGLPVGRNNAFRNVFSDRCRLLREWADSNGPIFLDFAVEVLWWFIARSADGATYVGLFPRAHFIEAHRAGATESGRQFDAFVNDAPKLIASLRLRR